MEAVKEIVSRLIAGGMDPAEAAALLARAAVEFVPQTAKRSSAAIRQARYRERKTHNESVTNRNADVTQPTVTNRNESVTNHNGVTDGNIYILSSSKESKKDKLPRRKKERNALPKDFCVSEAMIEFATKRGWQRPKIDRQFEKFCNHHWSKGTLAADWAACWRTWVLNDYDAKNEPAGRSNYYDPRSGYGDDHW